MKVGFVQFSPVFGDKNKNFEQVKDLLHNISADLIVLPELFNTGYTFLNKKELGQLAEPSERGETSNFIRALARTKNCCFVYGFAEKDDNLFYNSAALISTQRFIGIYRKSHLFFEEKNYFQPGNTGFQIFEYNKVKLGILICFDWIFPEAIRTLALKGVQIVLHPANLVLPHCPDSMKVRALENRIFIITADRNGEEKRNGKEYKFIGKSQIISPDGKALIRAEEEDCVKVVDINPEEALEKKVTKYNDVIADRRQDLYFK
jgi:predicted amidohydrolase